MLTDGSWHNRNPVRRKNGDFVAYPWITRNVSLKRGCNPRRGARPSWEPQLNSEARLLPAARSSLWKRMEADAQRPVRLVAGASKLSIFTLPRWLRQQPNRWA